MSENPPKPSNPAPPPPAPRRRARPVRTCRTRCRRSRVGQDLVGLVDLLEPLLGSRIGVDVRMPLLGELAEGALDVGVATRCARRRGPGRSRARSWPSGRKDTRGARRMPRPSRRATLPMTGQRRSTPDVRRATPDRRPDLRPRRDLRFRPPRRPPVKLSHAEFGPRVGLPSDPGAARPATGSRRPCSCPGHTLVDVPREHRRDPRPAATSWLPRLVSRGLRPSYAAARRPRSSVGPSRPSRDRTGAPPAGYRAPYWALGPATLGLVEAAGFRYDSSLMADDYRLYRVRHGDRHSIGEGRVGASPAHLVEVPGLLGARRLAASSSRAAGATAFGRRPRSSRSGSAELRYAYAHTPTAAS